LPAACLCRRCISHQSPGILAFRAQRQSDSQGLRDNEPLAFHDLCERESGYFGALRGKICELPLNDSVRERNRPIDASRNVAETEAAPVELECFDRKFLPSFCLPSGV
jgi:hypothetical protein